MSIKTSQAIRKCSIYLKSSGWFTLGSDDETMFCDTGIFRCCEIYLEYRTAGHLVFWKPWPAVELKKVLSVTIHGTSKQNIHKLQLMQNFAARILTDTGKYDHVTPALKALGWLTIEDQLWLRDVTMMYKCVNNLVPAYISCKIGKRSNAHAYNLRNSEDLNLPGCRTAAAQSGFFYRAAKAWNSLSNNTRTARSLRSFKKHAKAELMKK